MQPISFDDALDRILEQDRRYDREAYHFLRDALDYTQTRLAREQATRARKRGAGKSEEDEDFDALPRHLTGPELLEGIREFALEQFGPMVPTVFDEWGIKETRDFGEIVFLMVDAQLLSKTPQDSIDDFDGVYDFHTAFREPFLPTQKPGDKPRPRVTKN